MHLKRGCRVECTCRAEISADSGLHKEHQDPYLPLSDGAGNELCVVCEPVKPGACIYLLFSLFAGPSIVTPPKDIWNVTGAQIYLSCEVIGIPTPVLIWNKIIRGQYGVQRMELLPGDRENLAIQTRGGPEKHEVTGWVLISPLSKEDAGEYECHASNAKGEATASAKIHVVETLHEIALTKDDGAEL
uniref:Insulin-like growth factor-binding protein 7 n=1 Tax=Cyanistes caeruleus TaxID=156563 RepID=A0A8C0ZIX0_CYACU